MRTKSYTVLVLTLSLFLSLGNSCQSQSEKIPFTCEGVQEKTRMGLVSIKTS